MDSRDASEKVMQAHALKAKQLAELVVEKFGDQTTSFGLHADVLYELKEGKWPRRPK
jgi:hypothetical protein